MTQKDILRILRDYGITSGILLVLFTLLWLCALASQPIKENSLRQEITAVLDTGTTAGITVADSLPIGSPLDASAAVFRVQGMADYDYAAIVRVATIAGPVPAVFVHNSRTRTAEFAGYAAQNEAEAAMLDRLSRPTQITFWEKKLSLLFKGLASGSGGIQ